MATAEETRAALAKLAALPNLSPELRALVEKHEAPIADFVAKAASYEDRQQAISQALDAYYRGGDANSTVYVYAQVTTDSAVTYTVSGGRQAGTWQAPYEYDEKTGEVKLGTPVAAKIIRTSSVVTKESPHYLSSLLDQLKPYIPDGLYKKLRLRARPSAGGRAAAANRRARQATEKQDEGPGATGLGYTAEDLHVPGIARVSHIFSAGKDGKCVECGKPKDEHAPVHGGTKDTEIVPGGAIFAMKSAELRRFRATPEAQKIHKFEQAEWSDVDECRVCGGPKVGDDCPPAEKVEIELEEGPIWLEKSETFKEGLVFGVALVPELGDAHHDGVSAAEIEKAAHRWMAESRLHNDQHLIELSKSQAVPVESYIAPVDFSVTDPAGKEHLVVKGSWVVGSWVRDPILRSEIAEGRKTGFSIEGSAVKRKAQAA